MSPKSFDMKVRGWDARFNFPRPAEEQHLSSYRAFLRLVSTATSGLAIVTSALASFLLLSFAAYRLLLVDVTVEYVAGGSAIGLMLILGLLAGDLGSLTIPYTRFRQRETFGTARRASVQDLRGLGMLVRRNTRPDKPMVVFGTFGAFYSIAFDLDRLSGHVAVIGPPRSGKSASVFMPVIRQFSPYGSCVALDSKGELYTYTSHYYEEVYRLDLENPQASDRLPILSDLKNNPEAAGALCALMISVNPNKKTGDNPFWKDMAVALGKAIFLHLASVIENPTPAHALQFLGTHPRDGKIDYLHLVMSRTADRTAREAWNTFHRFDQKLQAGVIATLMSTLDQFTQPSAQVVFSAPTEQDKQRGVKRIDLAALRRHGSIIYVVIGEGKAKTLSHVLGTIFGHISRELEAMQTNAYECPCLMAVDEAGNIYLDGLTDRVGIGRGLGIYYLVGYQSKTQPEEQYGVLGGAALLQAVNTKILLSGITAETAEWASKMIGTTTVMQHSMTDAVHNALDNERLAETGRQLMEPSAFRELLQHRQACMLVTGAPFIPFALLENAKDSDPRRSMTPHYNFDEPPSYIALQGKAWQELKREVEAALTACENDPDRVNQALAKAKEDNDVCELPDKEVSIQVTSVLANPARVSEGNGGDEACERANGKAVKGRKLKEKPADDKRDKILSRAKKATSNKREQADSALRSNNEISPESSPNVDNFSEKVKAGPSVRSRRPARLKTNPNGKEVERLTAGADNSFTSQCKV